MSSRVETLADQFENKEALAEAYIREYERVAARAKVKLNQVAAQANGLEAKAAELRRQSSQWAERARRVHGGDRRKAMECVARMKEIDEARDGVLNDLEETRGLQAKMSGDVGQILRKLETLKRKQQNLSGRQACAQAVQALHHADGAIQGDVDELLARWETDVVARELHGAASLEPVDPLAREFETEERERELERTLEELVAAPRAMEEDPS